MAYWQDLYRKEEDEYRSNPLWEANGICRYAGTDGKAIDLYYPWTCSLCLQTKKFGSLEESVPHLSQEKHCNRILEKHGFQPPALPKWPPVAGAVPAGIGPRVWSCEHPSASVLPGHPATTRTTQIERACWSQVDASAGGSAADATLAWNYTCMTTAAVQVSTPCDPLAAHRRSAPPPPPRVGLQDPADCLSASPARKAPPPSPPATAVSASRSKGTAPASPPRPASCTSLPGMAGIVAKQFAPTPPWTSPKPPPPTPPPSRASDDAPSATQVPAPRWWGAPAGAPSHGAASARAVVSRGHWLLEGEAEQEPSES